MSTLSQTRGSKLARLKKMLEEEKSKVIEEKNPINSSDDLSLCNPEMDEKYRQFRHYLGSNPWVIKGSVCDFVEMISSFRQRPLKSINGQNRGNSKLFDNNGHLLGKSHLANDDAACFCWTHDKPSFEIDDPESIEPILVGSDFTEKKFCHLH
jgi:hypothetical protein